MAQVGLSRRALLDIDEIDLYSSDRWGAGVAARYLADLQAALERLRDAPSLLRQWDECSPRLRFYTGREHVFVCDVIDDDVYVLAVRHAAMDLPRRIAELEPVLIEEVEILHNRVVASRGSS